MQEVCVILDQLLWDEHVHQTLTVLVHEHVYEKVRQIVFSSLMTRNHGMHHTLNGMKHLMLILGEDVEMVMMLYDVSLMTQIKILTGIEDDNSVDVKILYQIPKVHREHVVHHRQTG